MHFEYIQSRRLLIFMTHLTRLEGKKNIVQINPFPHKLVTITTSNISQLKIPGPNYRMERDLHIELDL